jgi:hypothetical protein
MRIVVQSEDELYEISKNLLHISVNLRYWTKEWDKHHGKTLLERKQYWQNRMDEYLEELGARKTQLLTEVKIEIKN